MTRKNRLIALLLAIVMAVAGSVTAWAAELRGESVIDVFKYTEAENLQRELEYMNTACNEVTGPRSNPGDTAGPNVAYDSVMGTGYIYSDQHPEVTDAEYLLREYYCYPGEPNTSYNSQGVLKVPYNNHMDEALPLLQEFVHSFDWIHSDERTRYQKVYQRIGLPYVGEKDPLSSSERNERFLALRQNRGMCSEISDEFAALCEIVGLECDTYLPSYAHQANLVRIGEQWYAVDPTQKRMSVCKAVDYDAEYNRSAREFEASPDGERMRQWREIGQRLEAGEITQEECERLNNELWQKTDEQILAEMAAR